MVRKKNKFVITRISDKDINEKLNVKKKIKLEKNIDIIEENVINIKKESNNEINSDLSQIKSETISNNDNKDNKIEIKSGIVSSNKFKRNRFRDKCMANRIEKGMILLSPNVEKKIYNLKKVLRNKGLDGEEIKQIVRKRRRQEENKYNRDMSKGCFKCRQMGHKLSDCPLINNDYEQGVDVCYRCGSSEHKLSDCNQISNDLPFVKCFLCKETGHLTRTCPLNKRGIYPKGGSCIKCQSIDHLIKDCPQNQEKEKESDDMTLTTMDVIHSVDEEIMENNSKSKEKNNKLPKVVKF